MPTPTSADIVSLLIAHSRENGRRPAASPAYSLIRERFLAEPSPAYRAALADFERRPARHQERFRQLLDGLLRDDPEFAGQLALRLAVASSRTDQVYSVTERPAELPPPLAAMQDHLVSLFSLEELKDLAFAQGFIPDTIPAATSTAFARGLILVCWRQGMLGRLAAAAEKERPLSGRQFDLAGLPAEPPVEFEDVPVVRQTNIFYRVETLRHIRSIFSDTRQVLAFLAVTLAVAALIGGALWYSRQPRRMDGEFNIAVAQVATAGDAAGRSVAPVISRQLADILRLELDALDRSVQVSSRNMPPVDSPEEAARLAGRVNAHLVVYGASEVLGNQVRFTPVFYVNDTLRPDVFEMNGDHHLNAPLTFPTDALIAGKPPTAEAVARAALLTDFARALVLLAADEPAAARRTIESAVRRAEALGPFPGREVVYLFASHIARVQGDRDAAAAYAEDALAANPNYGRGYIARANVLFDRQAYFQARADYQQALALPGQPESQWIAEKAHVGLGNVYLAQLLAVGADAAPDNAAETSRLAEEGLAHYNAVTAAFEATAQPDERLRVLAALAYAYTGRIYHATGDTAAAAEAYRAALALPLPPLQQEETQRLLDGLRAEED